VAPDVMRHTTRNAAEGPGTQKCKAFKIANPTGKQKQNVEKIPISPRVGRGGL